MLFASGGSPGFGAWADAAVIKAEAATHAMPSARMGRAAFLPGQMVQPVIALAGKRVVIAKQ